LYYAEAAQASRIVVASPCACRLPGPAPTDTISRAGTERLGFIIYARIIAVYDSAAAAVVTASII
jgi:hypothetical protein